MPAPGHIRAALKRSSKAQGRIRGFRRALCLFGRAAARGREEARALRGVRPRGSTRVAWRRCLARSRTPLCQQAGAV
eukprot:353024-Chlamydomonas_euryale.AAC.2